MKKRLMFLSILTSFIFVGSTFVSSQSITNESLHFISKNLFILSQKQIRLGLKIIQKVYQYG
jgi:hypothetical protein